MIMSESSSQTADRGVAENRVLEVLKSVQDPEIPVLSIVDLGIVRGVSVGERGEVRVKLTPTYSGCPATEVIEGMVLGSLRAAGFDNVAVERVLAPAWTSDWISQEGREKLREYGIAPPVQSVSSIRGLIRGAVAVRCPQCNSEDTSMISEFGSTPCKALYRCNECREPFDYFKCH
jgi:ring-1,2-phenylacetyl-CoA epoxidase subunit PaaD